MSQLVFRRHKALWQDRAREYRIFVDGKEVARIGNDAEARIEVDPGTHSVRMKIDWCRSREIQVVLSPEEIVNFECGPSANPFLVLFYITFWKDKYIWLRQVHDAASMNSLKHPHQR